VPSVAQAPQGPDRAFDNRSTCSARPFFPEPHTRKRMPRWQSLSPCTWQIVAVHAHLRLPISGTHQSDAGATAWLDVRSYLDSTRKHGLNAFDAIRRAFTGNLWMPPIALAS
jgi:hypothetical protein